MITEATIRELLDEVRRRDNSEIAALRVKLAAHERDNREAARAIVELRALVRHERSVRGRQRETIKRLRAALKKRQPARTGPR